MNRSATSLGIFALAILAASMAADTARAHFPWLATDEAGHALLFFGESPEDRTYHTPEAVAAAKVLRRMGKMAPTEVALAAVESDEFVGRKSAEPVPAGGVLEAEIRYGIYHGMLLDYYARHASNDKSAAIAGSGLKLVGSPRVADDGVELALTWEGKPLAGAPVTMTDAEGVPTEKESDADGIAKFDEPGDGLIGFLYSRMDNEANGDVDGEKYTSAGAYGTVTMWIGKPKAGEEKARAAAADAGEGAKPQAAEGVAALPEPVASFGAAVADGWLYVYGGHVGEEHAHSLDNLSTHFRRIKLDGGAAWEELPMQTPLQGLPLVAHGGKLYRVGGLNFRNKSDADPDMHSVAEFACFDPVSGEWTELPPLPEARSSHDAVIIGDTLYVVGGWTLSGEAKGAWLETAWEFDLAKPQAGWQAVAAPTFKRRALAAAEWNGNLVALGGMDDDGKLSRRVDAFDPAAKQWTELPKLPRSDMAGFGVSAWNLGGKLLVSGADGEVYGLADDGSKWESVGELATGRFFHRLMPGGESTLLAVAGASADEGHLATIESFTPGEKN